LKLVILVRVGNIVDSLSFFTTVTKYEIRLMLLFVLMDYLLGVILLSIRDWRRTVWKTK
jgi:hypothetical protein